MKLIKNTYSTLNNPRVSDEAKQNAQSMLDQLGGDQPSHELYSESGEQNKDPMRVNAGLKAYVVQMISFREVKHLSRYTDSCLVPHTILMYRTKQGAVLLRGLPRTLRSKSESYC